MNFIEFIGSEHPDPDNLQNKKIMNAEDELNRLASAFVSRNITDSLENTTGYILIKLEKSKNPHQSNVSTVVQNLYDHEVDGLLSTFNRERDWELRKRLLRKDGVLEDAE